MGAGADRPGECDPGFKPGAGELGTSESTITYKGELL